MKKDMDKQLGDFIKNMPEDEFRKLYDELGEYFINLVQTEAFIEFKHTIPVISRKNEKDMTDEDMDIVNRFNDMVEDIGKKFLKKYPKLKKFDS